MRRHMGEPLGGADCADTPSSADARAYQPVGSCAYPSEFQPGTSLRRGTGLRPRCQMDDVACMAVAALEPPEASVTATWRGGFNPRRRQPSGESCASWSGRCALPWTNCRDRDAANRSSRCRMIFRRSRGRNRRADPRADRRAEGGDPSPVAARMGGSCQPLNDNSTALARAM